MFEKILAPLDGSQLAECVLPHVAAVASAFKASVTLLHVLDGRNRGNVAANPVEWQLGKAEMQAYLTRVQSRLEARDLATDSVIMEGPAARRIVDAVRQHEIDLLILSSHGQSGLAPWNVSGVVEKVIQDVPTSLLLVRACREMAGEEALARGYRRIMLPLDGSKRAECVLAPAEILSRHWDSELLLTHIISRPRMFRATPLKGEDRELLDQVLSRYREEASHYFQKLQERLPVRTEVRLVIEENINAALQELVDQDDVDLILLSAHGHGCSALQRYGSLVSSCVLYGTVPLLIVQDLAADRIAVTASKLATQTWEEASVRLPAGTGLQTYLSHRKRILNELDDL